MTCHKCGKFVSGKSGMCTYCGEKNTLPPDVAERYNAETEADRRCSIMDALMGTDESPSQPFVPPKLGILLASAIISTAYLFLLFVPTFGLLGALLLIPHQVCVFIAMIFSWVSWATGKTGFALSAGILYCVALLCAMTRLPYVLVQLILSFIGYSQLQKARVLHEDGNHR